MATIECKSAQSGIESIYVKVPGISDEQVSHAQNNLDALLITESKVSNAVARSYVSIVKSCPDANPSDLWQHIIYRHLLNSGWSDNRWKRVSGYALEQAFMFIYNPLLTPHGLRMRSFTAKEANNFLEPLGISTPAPKVDLFLEGHVANNIPTLGGWKIFGGVHVKASIAERIQDDVPASLSLMQAGLLSIVLTMDAKSYPPPHGDCINYGELGGRSVGIDKIRIKRDYIERQGQFDGLFSFNTRTPPSPRNTLSGKRIYTVSPNEPQPDPLVSFLINQWRTHISNTG